MLDWHLTNLIRSSRTASGMSRFSWAVPQQGAASSSLALVGLSLATSTRLLSAMCSFRSSRKSLRLLGSRVSNLMRSSDTAAWFIRLSLQFQQDEFQQDALRFARNRRSWRESVGLVFGAKVSVLSLARTLARKAYSASAKP